MNQFQQKFLDHLVKLAVADKSYAWWAAKNYAAMYPEELSELPALLTTEMKKRQALNVQQTGGARNEIRKKD